jgi:proline racemase
MSHTAGEPFRIVTAGAPTLSGATVLERRASAQAEHDSVRRMIINEPRGHADQYGCYVVEPDDDGAAFGVIFFHKDGYSTACGHGTIAIATWAVDSGLVEPSMNGATTIRIDVPSGRVGATIETSGNAVDRVTFENVPSFVTATDVEMEVNGLRMTADISFGGAFYASVDADRLGIEVTPDNIERFIGLGRAVKSELADHDAVVHGDDHRLSGLYGVVFHQRVGRLHQRNITVFADGEVDRSPCGSGTSARLAVLHRRSEIGVGDVLIHDSVISTRFQARVTSVLDHQRWGRAVVTEVTGSAYRTGVSTFSIDPRDPLGVGFQIR